MVNTTLVILAAGGTEAFGNLKQITPIDKHGNKIIDFSIYDAVRAGFKNVVIVIEKEHQEEFAQAMGEYINRYINIRYAYQDLNMVPDWYCIPEGREKPWGTAHALWSCKHLLNEPFVVINADDYYGQDAFEMMYEFLTNFEGEPHTNCSMIGYLLGNTLSEYGSVSRGCCAIDQDNYVVNIEERRHIDKKSQGLVYSKDNGESYQSIPVETIVSMNMWGLTPHILEELDQSMEQFFYELQYGESLSRQWYLSAEINKLLQKGNITVKVLPSKDCWFGLTYKEDKGSVIEAIQQLKNQGVYPEKLWE